MFLLRYVLSVFLITLYSFSYAQTVKVPYDQSQTQQQVQAQVRVREIEQKMQSLNLTDLQNSMSELNILRAKIDDHLDHILKNCQNVADKEKECMSNAKIDLKNLWSQYFKLKEKYLSTLHEHYLKENEKQLKSMLEYVESLQSNKTKRP